MPSQPKQKRLRAFLADLAVAELGEEATALDWVCSWIEDGRSINAMHAHVSERFEDLSRPWLSRQIHSLAPDAGDRIFEARRRASHVLVENAQDIADSTEGEHSREAIASAKLRTDILLWRAKAYNRQDLGEKSPTLTLSVQMLHLDALRSRSAAALSATAAVPAALPSGEDADFEIVPASISGE